MSLKIRRIADTVLTAALILSVTNCSRVNTNQTISMDLPLSLYDIEEIRVGDQNHSSMFGEDSDYKLHPSPELQAYVSFVGLRIARISDRPNLPYKFFVVDSEKVDVFGFGGGRVYVTRGLLDFVDLESELAAGLAHEIGHTASFRYKPEEVQKSKVKKAYQVFKKASDYAGDFGGVYGSAGRTGLRAIEDAVPYIKRRFSKDEEKEADQHAIRYLVKAGYDPDGLKTLIDKLSQVEIDEVGAYVDYLKAHPPLPERRNAIAKQVKRRHFEKSRMPLAAARPALEVESAVGIIEIPASQKNLASLETAALPAAQS